MGAFGARGTLLVAAPGGGFSEWSAGGSVRLDPGTPDRCVALSVAPSWGTIATTAATLWSLPDTVPQPTSR